MGHAFGAAKKTMGWHRQATRRLGQYRRIFGRWRPLRARRPCRSSIRPGARGISSTSGQLMTRWSWRPPRALGMPRDHLPEDPWVRASSPRRAS